MADKTTDGILAELARSDRSAYLEQRLFVLSPFGPFITGVILLTLLFGSYLLIASLEHIPFLIDDGSHVTVNNPARTAFTLSLMLSTALFIQRYTRVKERADRIAFAATLGPDAITSQELVSLTPSTARLLPATIAGVIIGLVASWLLYAHEAQSGYRVAPATFAWFGIVTTVLVISFTRGVELTRAGGQAARRAIDHELIVDLLRIDKLSVWGRSAARFSLIWFTVSAVSCLFFIDNGLNAFTVSMLATFAALGIWVFVATMERVHQKIRVVKAAELERVRGEIDALRQPAVHDANAATRLQGLLAYETRIAAAQEWPFDQTTLVRVVASALILTVPWFGQAIAQFVIERVGHFSG